jgi:hypothetical protein
VAIHDRTTGLIHEFSIRRVTTSQGCACRVSTDLYAYSAIRARATHSKLAAVRAAGCSIVGPNHEGREPADLRTPHLQVRHRLYGPSAWIDRLSWCDDAARGISYERCLTSSGLVTSCWFAPVLGQEDQRHGLFASRLVVRRAGDRATAWNDVRINPDRGNPDKPFDEWLAAPGNERRRRINSAQQDAASIRQVSRFPDRHPHRPARGARSVQFPIVRWSAQKRPIRAFVVRG